MSDIMTGGCQCGRIRYEARIDSDDAYLCHCRMCRRATGGISIALLGIERANVTWTTRAPDSYQSSPIAHRGFCAECGTPLTFEFLHGSTGMDLTVGSFDHPERFRPVHHYATESLQEAWIDTRDLPRKRSDENANVVQRWMEACGKLPD